MRSGNRPDRRIAAQGAVSKARLDALAASVLYEGSGLHKRRPGDYGFRPPVNPRHHKSLCDDLRAVLTAEAAALLADGITRGMVSPVGDGELPKYVWAVDSRGEVYEAKSSRDRPDRYHGYRLGEDDDMRRLVLREWKQRCPAA